jgi:hypothetical protein
MSDYNPIMGHLARVINLSEPGPALEMILEEP